MRFEQSLTTYSVVFKLVNVLTNKQDFNKELYLIVEMAKLNGFKTLRNARIIKWYKLREIYFKAFDRSNR